MPKDRKRYAERAGRRMLLEAVDAGTDSSYDHEERLRSAFPSLSDSEVRHALREYRAARERLIGWLMTKSTANPET